jgi:hypothetical protein
LDLLKWDSVERVPTFQKWRGNRVMEDCSVGVRRSTDRGFHPSIYLSTYPPLHYFATPLLPFRGRQKADPKKRRPQALMPTI